MGKMMDKDEIAKRIEEEEDYIRCPKCSNSLSRFIAKNGDGVEDATIARLLMVTEIEVQKIYEEAIKTLKEGMKESES